MRKVMLYMLKPVLGLNEPAVESALQLKFKPGEVNGKPVKAIIGLPWIFEIKEQRKS